MGFYGNITNTSRTQFQFDKTYSNRRQMDNAASTDGIYIGRYVLVEYDQTLAADWCTTAFMKTDNSVLKFYTSANLSESTRILFGVGNVVKDKYIRVPATYNDVNGGLIVHNFDEPAIQSDTLYRINGKLDANNNVSVTKISEVADSPYNENYQIDIKTYGPGRGYDSTVWQKVYADQNEKYVMIAELNTVVPTFDVSADAPTLSPLLPHFDVDSTNIYYKLHWQPAWGLRVKSALNSIQAQPIDDAGETITGSTDLVTLSTVNQNSKLYSDESTVWSKSGYNPLDNSVTDYVFSKEIITEDKMGVIGKWLKSSAVKDDEKSIPGAIYYNKAGFKPSTISYSPTGMEDHILLEPTGLSGHKYNAHDAKGGKEPKVDTQELSIILPSIGNSIANMWDIIYGDEELNNGKDRDMSIDWKEASVVPADNGHRLVTLAEEGYGYEPAAAETLAGAINSAHDIMGMIISKRTENPSALTSDQIKSLNSDYIYYFPTTNKYYRKYKTYGFGTNDVTNFTKAGCFSTVNLSSWPTSNTQYFYKDTPLSQSSTKPNYILENSYYPDKEYYTVEAPSDSQKVSFSGTFKPYTYFELQSNITVSFGEMNRTTDRYITSMDKEYQANKNYVQITHKSIGDNVRIFEADKYFEATFTKETKNDINKHTNGIYFVLRDGRYYRDTDDYNPNANYYIPTFTTASGAINNNKQYFTISQKQEGEYIYIEKVVYNKATGVTANNFNDRPYYTETQGLYTLAESYNANTTYYTKTTTYELTLSSPVISPTNAIEVKLVDYENNKYYYYQPINSQGYPQYTLINQSLVSFYTSNIVTITVKTVTNFYSPNSYYYKITDAKNSLYGSYVLDGNKKETPGRQYYSGLGAATKISTIFYEPFKYYKLVDGEYVIDTSLTKSSSQYYTKSKNLCVYQDTNGILPAGYEWNLNVTNIPSNITLREKVEEWKLEELKGFGKHFNTMHGLLLRANRILNENDTLTRDYDSIRGYMNRLNDIFLKFNELNPSQFLTTDTMGRIKTTTFQGAGDSVITVTLDTSIPKVTVTHKDSALTAGTYSVGNQTPNFGATFNIPTFTIDAKGHIVAQSTVTAKIPALSLSDGTGNIMTGLTLNSSTGAFTTQKANVGTLALTGYSIANAASAVSASDTINSALGKIEYKLGNTTVGSQIDVKINALNKTDAAVNAQLVSAVSEANGIITVTRRALVADDIPVLSASKVSSLTGYVESIETDKTLKETDTLLSALGKLEARIKVLEG